MAGGRGGAGIGASAGPGGARAAAALNVVAPPTDSPAAGDARLDSVTDHGVVAVKPDVSGSDTRRPPPGDARRLVAGDGRAGPRVDNGAAPEGESVRRSTAGAGAGGDGTGGGAAARRAATLFAREDISAA
jgi:hypothetical protein